MKLFSKQILPFSSHTIKIFPQSYQIIQQIINDRLELDCGRIAVSSTYKVMSRGLAVVHKKDKHPVTHRRDLNPFLMFRHSIPSSVFLFIVTRPRLGDGLCIVCGWTRKLLSKYSISYDWLLFSRQSSSFLFSVHSSIFHFGRHDDKTIDREKRTVALENEEEELTKNYLLVNNFRRVGGG